MNYCVLLLIVVSSSPLFAQTVTAAAPPAPPARADTIFVRQAPTLTIANAPAGTVAALTHEFGIATAHPVSGAPYSGEQTTEQVQTLADGNRIVNATTVRIYRDSQGRTRRETTFSNAGNGDAQPQMISIEDPVAGTTYTLNPETNTASKLKVRRAFALTAAEAKPAVGASAGTAAGKPAPPNKEFGTTENVMFSAGPGEGQGGMTAGPVMFRSATRLPSSEWKKEDLGTQEIAGVKAVGTRMTTTIPANAVGNEQPLVITSETWYSPELKITVRSTHKDPRMGETTVTFQSLTRGEPDPSLFQVPAGYTVTNDQPGIVFTPKDDQPGMLFTPREAPKPAN